MTVKELAKICNVHYNTMRKWLINNNIKKTSKIKNAQFVLTDEVVNRAKEYFNITDEKVKKNDDILVEQLQQKDIQIVKQQELIEHLQQLLENQQILTLKAQEKVELLEMKNTEYSEKQKNEEEPKQKKFWKFWQ